MSHAVVIGGGPAGLMAAEALLDRGVAVDLYDAMPSLGRKFLMAGHGGLNLTHSEPFASFVARYAEAAPQIAPVLRGFGPDALRAWAHDLGIETFVGTSGRVFPTDFKAAPLLRAWLRRLRACGLIVHVRHRWEGWTDDGALAFTTPNGPIAVRSKATVLALGGASWPSLGSTGAWAPTLRAKGIDVAPLRAANCGFDTPWSEHFRARFAGEPVKTVAISHGGQTVAGEFVVTDTGIEGGAVYTLSAGLRDAIAANGSAVIAIDLAPDRDIQRIAHGLGSRGKRSLATALKAAAGLSGVKAGLVREVLSEQALADSTRVAAAIKALPLTLLAARPLAEAISSAGGVRWAELNRQLMLRSMPGVFCAGEMLDWEAPTGGYLLTACMALGRACGGGAADWLSAQP
jgi:uncharacterized flavoprotein (TIGR03862 family)